jgi:hypothetical protein
MSILINRSGEIEEVSISILYLDCVFQCHMVVFIWSSAFFKDFLYVITLFDVFHYVTLVHSFMPYHYSLLYGICIIVYNSLLIIKIKYTMMYIMKTLLFCNLIIAQLRSVMLVSY